MDAQNRYEIVNVYENFWQNDDPVFKYAERLYENIVTQTFDNAENLRVEIGTLHWLLANVAPYNRGSSAGAEFVTDALWLLHGYLPQPFEKGKSPDLEALFTPKVADFLAIYPMGKKIA